MNIPRPLKLLAAVVPMTGALVAGTSGVAQAQCASDRGYYYYVTSDHGLVLDGKGKPTIVHNGTKNNETLAMSQSSSGTVQWSVNGEVGGSGGVDFGIVKIGVENKIGGSYTQSNSESQTKTVTITIRPGYYGILQTGVFRRYTYGHYGFDNGNCTVSNERTITTKLPITADGSDSTTNTTGRVPWDQQ